MWDWFIALLVASNDESVGNLGENMWAVFSRETVGRLFKWREGIVNASSYLAGSCIDFYIWNQMVEWTSGWERDWEVLAVFWEQGIKGEGNFHFNIVLTIHLMGPTMNGDAFDCISNDWFAFLHKWAIITLMLMMVPIHYSSRRHRVAQLGGNPGSHLIALAGYATLSTFVSSFSPTCVI